MAVRLVRDSTVVRTGRTASDGSYRFVVDSAYADLELAVQKVGYVSTRRRVVPVRGSTVDVSVLVTPIATILDSVHINAHRTAEYVVPVIDADEIARSGRNLTGIFSLIEKLRPRATMAATPRRAVRPCLESQTRYYINEQWVNPAQYDGLSDFPADRIAYVQFVDCFDRSLEDNDHPGARHVYITLKPNAHYSPGGGVQLDSSAVRDAGKMADSGRAVRVPRGKLLGVYDEVSGDPIDGVEVKDIGTGMSVHTTVTGTAALFFARTDATMLGLSKLGYRPMTMMIGDPWSDSIPITVTLMPRGVTTVETKRLSPADTVEKLIVAGFSIGALGRRRRPTRFSRRAILAAPHRSPPRRAKRDVRSARAPCMSTVRTRISPRRSWHSEKSRSIDQLFPIETVLAVETYIGGEIPAAIRSVEREGRGRRAAKRRIDV